jgi:hypothetical protein
MRESLIAIAVVAFLLLMSTGSFAVTVTQVVTANPEWTQTSLFLNAGDTFSVTASGSWAWATCCPPGFVGPDGAPGWDDNNGFITVGEHKGALIGAIEVGGLGESFFRSLPQDHPDFFVVGSNLPSFTAYRSGYLYLGFNDWGFSGNQPAVSDNAGSVTATITSPAPVPEPGTLLLLASGFLGLGAWRRRKT